MAIMIVSVDELVSLLMSPPEVEPQADLGVVLDSYRRERVRIEDSFFGCVSHGRRCDRLGWAFVGAYCAALDTLVPGVDQAALCVTEKDGNHPRAIRSTLTQTADGYVLQGHKTFVTFGSMAKELLVVAREGEHDNRPALSVCRIPAARDGVSMEPGPKTPFVPEIPHTQVRFDHVIVRTEELLPGDGYLGYVKPFRTVEDIHVLAGTLAYLSGVALRADAAELGAAFVHSLLSLRALAQRSPLDRYTHIALHGAFAQLRIVTQTKEFAQMWSALGDEAERDRWHRDAALLNVAGQARRARFARALSQR